jgi:hypothetical protein
MRFQTERCLQCGTPGRPTDLQSKYNLDERGTVPLTDYWFCSDEHYEEAIDSYVDDRDYSLQYSRANLSPKLRREILALYQEYEKHYANIPYDHDSATDRDFVCSVKNQFEQQKEEILCQWER